MVKPSRGEIWETTSRLFPKVRIHSTDCHPTAPPEYEMVYYFVPGRSGRHKMRLKRFMYFYKKVEG